MTARTDDGLSAFIAVRPRLFGVAYRLLGSACDAEDVVQDVWLRWQATDRRVVRSAPAFLTTTAVHLAITLVQSAHRRRETLGDPRFPELADASADPGVHAERGEALERAVRMLLDTLSPTERAAYVLTEAFDYPSARIADLLHVSDANARQIASRARKRLAAEGPNRPGASERCRRAETRREHRWTSTKRSRADGRCADSPTSPFRERSSSACCPPPPGPLPDPTSNRGGSTW
jgi:RNA polymerase sigma-70 factor (ECF subfamily)